MPLRYEARPSNPTLDLMHPLRSGLIGAWVMNRGADSRYRNLATPGRSDLKTFSEGAEFHAGGEMGFHLYNNDATQKIWIPDDSKNDFQQQSFTMQALFTNCGFSANDAAAGDWGFYSNIFLRGAGSSRAWVMRGAGAQTQIPIENGINYLMTYIHEYDGNATITRKGYVNGILVAQSNITGPLTWDATSGKDVFSFNLLNNQDFLAIADVRFWARALTAQEVFQQMNDYWSLYRGGAYSIEPIFDAAAGPSPINVSPDYVSNGATYDPTASVEINVSPGFVNNGAVYLPDPSFDLDISVPYIANGATYDPSASVEINISPEFVNNGVTYTPIASVELSVSPEYVSNGVVYSPTASEETSVSPGFIQNGIVYAPVALPDINVSPTFIQNGQVYEPFAGAEINVSPGFVNNGVLYAPIAMVEIAVSPEYISNGETYEPTLNLDGAILAAFINNGAVYDPSASVDIISQISEMISNGEVFSPSVGVEINVSPEFVNNGSVYLPTIAFVIPVDFINNGAVYVPSASVEIIVQPVFINNGTTYSPTASLTGVLSYGRRYRVPGSISRVNVPGDTPSTYTVPDGEE